MRGGKFFYFLRRSTDGGTTWEPRKKLGDMGASTVDNPTAIVDRKTGAIHMLYQIDYARAFYVRSDDDGRTSSPYVITVQSSRPISRGILGPRMSVSSLQEAPVPHG